MSDAVVLPVYNESVTVGEVLDAVRSYFDEEIIVIDDGSTDDTPRVLAARSDVTTLHVDHNCGYGCALRIGFRVAEDLGIDRLVTIDCDGQHESVHIPEFLSALENGCDIVSGSRYLPGSKSVGFAPPERQMVNQRVTCVINKVTGWGITDAFCGFKAYNVQALGCMSLTESGYAMPMELWAEAHRLGLVIREIPVERIYCNYDRSFGPALDDPEARHAYYMDVWNRAIAERT